MTSPQTDPTPDARSESVDELLAEVDELLQGDLPNMPDASVSEDDDVPERPEELFAKPAPYTDVSDGEADVEEDAAPDEDDEDDDPPPVRHPALRKLTAVFLVLVLVLSLAALAADLWLGYHHDRGKQQLTVSYDDVKIELPDREEQDISFDDGKTVTYNGHHYRLNENLSTILFMGIDRYNVKEVEWIGEGGQADVLLLVALDTRTGALTILNIPRDTYAEMVLHSGQGNWIGYEMHQICLAYAYGNGRETSCENTLDSVSHLLYGLPISKYISLDMDGVQVANDAVGGVTVTALEDIKLSSWHSIKQGEEVTLRGDELEAYIRRRDHDESGNVPRMERQKQYVAAFAATLTQQAKSDFSVISRLYQALTPYMVSDLDLSDAVFLAQTYLEHGMSLEFLSFDGTYDWLENSHGTKNAVYYPDEDSLFEAVLAVFYTQVD